MKWMIYVNPRRKTCNVRRHVAMPQYMKYHSCATVRIGLIQLVLYSYTLRPGSGAVCGSQGGSGGLRGHLTMLVEVVWPQL